MRSRGCSLLPRPLDPPRRASVLGCRRAPRRLCLVALATPRSLCSSPQPSLAPRTFRAPASCGQGPKRPPRPASGLPAAAALRAAGALSRCQRPAISARTLWLQLAQRPVYSVWVVIGDVRGCQGCWVWRWAGAETWWAVRFEWSTGFGFLTVSAPPPAAFRCHLTGQRQSRDHVGPGRTLVCFQRAPGARAVPSQSRLLGLIVHY